MDLNIKQFETPVDQTTEAFKKPLTDAGAKSGSFWRIPLESVKILPGFNVRESSPENAAQVQHLKALMLAEHHATGGNGWKDAFPAEVCVFNGEVFIANNGHTRFAAAKLANEEVPGAVTSMPAVPKPAGTTMEDLTVGLMTANAGKPLTPLGQAIVAHRLSTQFGRTNEEIAEKLGMTSKYVGQLLLLANAPQTLLDMVAQGKLSASLAIQKLMEKGSAAAEAELVEGLAEAEAKGKTKVTAKGTKTIEEKVLAKQKSLAGKMFALVEQLMEKPPEGIDPKIGDEIDKLLFMVEQVKAE